MKEYERINRKYEDKYLPKVHKALKSKVSSLINKIEEGSVQSGVSYLTQDIGNNQLTIVVGQLYREVGLRHARESERKLRKETKRFGKPQEWIDFINNYLRLHLLEKITFKVNETLRDYLLSKIQESIDKGLSVSETVKMLEELPFPRYQAARIVRTEVNRAANVGVKAQGESFEYELNKEWISVQDNRVRGRNPEDHADHLRMNGQVVDYYGRFRDPKNGHLLDFPGDKDADAGDTVNCRCSSANIAKRDKNGKLIPKKSRITVIRNFNRNQQVVIV